MPHMQGDLWRETETDVQKPKHCPGCSSPKLRFLPDETDEDEYDDECAEAWAIEQGEDPKLAHRDHRFYYYRDHYECRACGYYAAWGPRHYFNGDLSYNFDRPLMPDVAKRVQLEHDRQQAIEAGQLTLFGD
jgi:hypothetical protein